MRIIIDVDGWCTKDNIISYTKAINIDDELINSMKFEGLKVNEE